MVLQIANRVYTGKKLAALLVADFVMDVGLGVVLGVVLF